MSTPGLVCLEARTCQAGAEEFLLLQGCRMNSPLISIPAPIFEDPVADLRRDDEVPC